MTSLPSSTNLRAKASPMPLEPPVIRMVCPVSFIESPFIATYIGLCMESNGRKKISEAVQKVVSHTVQHFLPLRRVGKNPGNGYGARHRTENDEKVSFPLFRGNSRHKLDPRFHQAGNSFPYTGFGASNLSRQRRHRAAGVGTIAVLDR